MCFTGQTCSSFRPGHALHLIQSRLATSTPTGWVDAIVIGIDDEGTVTVRRFDTDEDIAVWNAQGAAKAVELGSPVAVHDRYHVLRSGRRQFNVLVVS